MFTLFWPSLGNLTLPGGPLHPCFLLHTLAKQEWAEPLGFSFLLEKMQSWSRCLSGLYWTRPYFPE